MKSKIEIEVENTAKHYRSVLIWFYFKKLILVGILYLIVVIPMLWLAFFGAGANPFNEKNNSVLLAMIFFAALPILIVGGILFNVWKQSENIAKTLELGKFIFSNEGVESFSKSSTVKVSWETFQKVKEIKEDFLFYPQKNIFYTIPKRFFQSGTQMNEFRNILLENLGKKAELKNP